jgi:Xaa-Pro dipeptidase
MASGADHRDRVLAAMADAGVDALVLGREANVRYVSGANRLWLAGTRPFAPSCVLVGATGAVHLLSVTDDGIPDDVPAAHLYPITWNPMNLVGAATAAIGGSAHRIGVDGMSPLFAQLFTMTLPGVELVDGEALLRSVRRVKTDADLAAIRAAIDVAQQALAAGMAMGPPVDAAGFAGAVAERAATEGVTTPAFPPVVDIRAGRVAARVGVLRAGWTGVVARSQPVDDTVRATAAAGAAASRPGETVDAVASRGVSVNGVGLGHEALRGDEALEPGLVLFVEAAQDGARWGDTVLVTEHGPEILSAG